MVDDVEEEIDKGVIVGKASQNRVKLETSVEDKGEKKDEEDDKEKEEEKEMRRGGINKTSGLRLLLGKILWTVKLWIMMMSMRMLEMRRRRRRRNWTWRKEER